MKRSYLKAVVLVVLALTSVGCACRQWGWSCVSGECREDLSCSQGCKHWDWVCSSRKVSVTADVVKGKNDGPVAATSSPALTDDLVNASSLSIVLKMWAALGEKNLEDTIRFSTLMEKLYSQKAKDMQASLKEYPALPALNIHKYWALNDVGTGMFILGEAYKLAGNKDEAVKAFRRVSADYRFAQCWDPQGWFWKPADVAEQRILEIESSK